MHQPAPCVLNISCQDLFDSHEDNQLVASVEAENPTDYTVTCQVVFKGYIREKEKLIYEFLHEQVWALIPPKATTVKEVSIDVWLSRFPPSMHLGNNSYIEYSVRATVDPWYENKFVEKKFVVKRKLYLKMPHAACYQTRYKLNKCIGHGTWRHRKCSPINIDFLTNKTAYAVGETIQSCWFKRSESAVQSMELSLGQYLEVRDADPAHNQLTRVKYTILSSKTYDVTPDATEGACALEIPTKIPTTIPMSLWNVLKIGYELKLEIKTEGQKELISHCTPIILTTVPIEEFPYEKDEKESLFYRAQDEDDDSMDDDDIDSPISKEENESTEKNFSIDLNEICIKTRRNGDLDNAYAEVFFEVNSNKPQKLKNLRMLFQGVVRAGPTWYEFVRFKGIISSSQSTAFSPGMHSVRVALPFGDSQLDSKILPPSLGDDVHYTCRATMLPWEKNYISIETNVFVDRFVDTWAKEEFRGEYREQLGSLTASMSQRCFQRGKHAYVRLLGTERLQNVRLELIQHRRIRRPELATDDSYCMERIVATRPAPRNYENWPREWSIHIPNTVPPSVEISYWNVLMIKYSLLVVATLEDGHDHRYAIPIWVGTNDDNLDPPENAKLIGIKNRVESPELPDLPEFEVINTEETMIQPYWVERYNDHTYGYDLH